MNCPYTYTLNLIYNLTAGLSGRPAKLVPEEMLAVKMMKLMSVRLDNAKVYIHSQTTLSGNRRFNRKLIKNVSNISHNILRSFIGEVGASIDKKSYPKVLQKEIEKLDTEVKTYKAQTAQIVDIFEKIYGKTDARKNTGVKEGKPGIPEYNNYDALIVKVTENCPEDLSEHFQELKTKCNISEQKVEVVLNNINESMDQVAALNWSGAKDCFVNYQMVGSKVTFAEWCFYAEYGAKRGFIDTTKVPKALSKRILSTLSTDSVIVPRLAKYIKLHPDIQVESTFSLFEKKIVEAQNQLVSTYNQKNSFAEKWLLQAIGINANTVDIIKERASNSTKKQEHFTESESVSGKCPFGYGPG